MAQPASNQKHEHTIFGAKRYIDVPVETFMTEAETAHRESLMPECQHGWFESTFQNAQLHYRKWLPKTKTPKAIIIYFHGIQAHSGQSFVTEQGDKLNMPLLCEQYLQHGYAIFAHDMYGHGYSEGTRWLIPGSYEINKKDSLNFIKLAVSDHDESTPVFLLGESYGCTLNLLVARYFQDYPEEAPKNFGGSLLLAPAIVGDLPPYPVYFTLRYILAPLLPAWRPFFMPNPVSADRIWRDPAVLKQRVDPRMAECAIGGAGQPFRLGTASNLVCALEAARTKAIPGLKVPFCVLHGTADYGVKIEGSEYLWEHSATPNEHREFHRIEGAYHDLLSDPERKTVVQKTIDWLERRLSM